MGRTRVSSLNFWSEDGFYTLSRCPMRETESKRDDGEFDGDIDGSCARNDDLEFKNLQLVRLKWKIKSMHLN